MLTRFAGSRIANLGHPIVAKMVSWWQILPANFGGGLLVDILRGYNGTFSGALWSPYQFRRGTYGSVSIATNSVQKVSVPSSFPHFDTFTYALWVRVATNETNFIVSKWDGTSGGSTFYFGEDGGSGKTAFVTRIAALSNESLSTSSNAIRLTGLFHIAITRDAATGIKQIFLNGRFDNSGTQTTGALVSNTTSITIGAGANVVTTGYGGNYDGLMAYNSVLSANEIAAVYEDSLAGHPKMLRRPGNVVIFNPPATAAPTFNAGWASGATSGVLGTGVF